MMNFGIVEFLTIALLRLLIPQGDQRSKLTKKPLRARIDAIIPLLEASDLLGEADRIAAIDALRCLKSVAKVRNMIAHDPFLQVQGKWIWAQIRDAEPDLTRVQGFTIEMLAVAVDHSELYGRILREILQPHLQSATGTIFRPKRYQG